MLPSLGPGEMLVVMIVAVVLFGKRLPEVGRSLGKGIVEFKKGLRGFEDGFHSAESSNVPAQRYEAARDPEFFETTVPKFEPPTTAPTPKVPADSEAPRD